MEQIGFLGVLAALPTFDPAKGKLGSHVAMYIRELCLAPRLQAEQAVNELPGTQDGVTLEPQDHRGADHDEDAGEAVQSLLSCLSAREANIITMYFGLDDGEEKTLCEIVARLSLSHQRVDQVLDGALGRLRTRVMTCWARASTLRSLRACGEMTQSSNLTRQLVRDLLLSPLYERDRSRGRSLQGLPVNDSPRKVWSADDTQAPPPALRLVPNMSTLARS